MVGSPASRSVWEGRRAALIIAHPGHELLVHGWLEQAKPLVFLLTASDGLADELSLTTTEKIVHRAGARIGSIFGRYTDRGMHQALLLHEKSRFNMLAQELADAFLSESIDIVVGDSAEGIDPCHDLCRVLIDAACAMVARVRPALRNFEFPLLGVRLARATTLHQRLDGDAWTRKLESCRESKVPIPEIRRHLQQDGLESLRDEYLSLATPWAIRHRRHVVYSHSESDCIPAIQFSEHLLHVAGDVQRFASGSRGQAA